MNKGFFFDRDGVLNKLIPEKNSYRPPLEVEELKINNKIINSVNSLKKNYKIFVVSNQPDVSRGKLKKETLNLINKEIDRNFNFNEILCEIRDDEKYKKPSPYMINLLIKKYSLLKKDSWIVGDRWVDIEAGKQAGIKTILLEFDYSYSPTSKGLKYTSVEPNITIKNVDEFNDLVNSSFL